MTKKQSNPTKRLSQTRTYVIAGEKYDLSIIGESTQAIYWYTHLRKATDYKTCYTQETNF